MRPVYLEFCGINSFSEKAEINFTKLLGGGLFGIFGDTGSGKSTILDCIHFALYGKIERSTGTESINYKRDKAYVVYDFEIAQGGERATYRVQRERRRKNNVAKAFLYAYDREGKLHGLAEGVNEVDKRVEEILGLGFDDFKKCIALPQGEFAGLVKARPSERLQLVSRLFDLEKYGEKLSATIRSRCEKTGSEAALLEAKMQENADGTQERIAAEREKFAKANAELKETETRLLKAEEELFAAQRRAEEKRDYDRLCLELKRAEEKLPYFSEKRKKAEKFPAAAAALEKFAAFAKISKAKELARAEAAKAEAALTAAQGELRTRRTRLEESDAEKEIERLLRAQAILEAAESDLAACREAERMLERCTAAYRAIKNKVPREDFEDLLAANEAAREGLGADESFTEYLKHNFKDVLLSETYGEVRADLRGLCAKYPQTERDVRALIEKYTLVKTGDERSFDIAAAQLEFKRIEARRKELAAERAAIEKRKKAFEDNEREKERIADDGKHFRERWEAAKKKTQLVQGLGTSEETKKQIGLLKAARKRAEEELRETERNIAFLAAEREKQTSLAETYAQQEREAGASMDAFLKENGFADVTDARALVAEIGDAKGAKERCDAFFEEFNACKKRCAEISADKFLGFSEEGLNDLQRRKRELSAEKESLLGAIAVGEKEIERLESLKEKYKTLEKEYKKKKREKELWEKLKTLTARGKFMEFIASEYLQEVCVSASKTLLSLTGGRYFLKYDDEFKAGDNLNGGALRGVRTLSGGETFLVSLSLALALSGAICAKSLRPIEFFFLDEGFGTLDEKLVDVVMDVLEKLRSRHFSIGVISHVEELKHRIDNKILVTGATDRAGSSVKIEAY